MYAMVGNARIISVLLPSLLLFGVGCGRPDDAGIGTLAQPVSTPGFAQKNQAVPQTQQVTVAVPYAAAQGAGDLNVVIVGWNDTIAQVSSVTDTKGNAYQLAVGPTQRPGSLTQSIYYAKNIAAAAAGANAVSVAFNQAASFADVRILEYSGIDAVNPLDVAVGASGTGATSNSGNATTTNANDLLVGANMVETGTTAAGSGYTLRVVTNPDGDIAEDRVVTATGGYNATATLSPSGGWIMQMVAFKAAGSAPPPPDTQPPTAPTNLTATAASGSQINLGWTASSDNVGVTGYLIERCQGAGCSDFAQIATAAGTSFMSSGLSPGTSYSYRVRATDAANNLSGYGNTATATTTAPDTQPPTAPTNLTATAASGSQINLGWTASTDDVGVTGYRIERCQGAGCSNFAQVATSTTASFGDAGLAASTSYSYRVRATDAANNLGAYSNFASATTQSAPTTPTFAQANSADPQTPQTLVTVPFAAAQAAGALNVVVVGWNDSVRQVASVADTKGNVYALAVGPTVLSGTASQAIYYAKNIAAASANGNSVTVTFTGAASFADIRILEYRGLDVTAPLDVAVANTGTASPSNSGAAVTTNAGDLLVAANMVQTGTAGAGTGFTSRILTVPDSDIVEDRTVTSAGSYSATAPLTSAGAWIMQMVAFKAAGGAPPPPDTQPPTAPTNLTATAPSGSQINLGWTASTDNVGVTGYLIERCQGAGCSSFAQIATAAGTSFTNSGLSPGTSYSYRVRATDAANNLSGYSSTATATTTAPDTQPPTAPTNLVATAASASQIMLTWSGSTDNVGVTGYLIERCQGAGCSSFAQVATSSTTSFADGGLAASTSYSYQVRATDAANNLSGYSNGASATTTNAQTTPTFAQGNSATPQTAQTVVTVPYTAAQAAGALNVVVVSWNDSVRQVSSVADSAGNVYALAVGPTVLAGMASQSIYYAKNIVASSGNSVTVTFTGAASFADVRILEYRGIDVVAPVDVVVANTGTANPSSSGTAVTTNAYDLLLGANIVQTGTSGAGSGFTTRSLTAPDGDVVEDRTVTTAGSYSATAPLVSPGGWIMQMVAFKAGGPPPPPDTTPPTVIVTSPVAGATLSGTVNVSVAASDSSGVLSVQLLVDGVVVGLPVTAPPYSFSLDTRKFANGSHSLGAYAWDTLRNAGSGPAMAVTFSNASPGNPAQSGIWSPTTAVPIVSVHQALLSSGKILMWDGQSFGFDARTWDLVTNSFTQLGAPANEFCSGHEQLADGRIIVVGGHVHPAHVGITAANAFDPITESWTVLPDMAFPRWYPTATILPDGRVLVLSGETSCDGCVVSVPEIYNPATNSWSRLNSAQFSFAYYPHVFVLPDGRVLVSSTTEDPTISQVLDLNALTWTSIGGPAIDGGSAVMYAPGKILKTGTSIDPDTASRPSVATAYVLDTAQPSPTWRAVASMGRARTYHTLTSLPDGNVLVTGGGPTTAATDTANAVLPAEIWSATTETWTTVAAMTSPRLYHSAALLLPDGRVVVLGGGRFDDVTAPTDQFNAEFFSPPYLFKGARPVIGSAPSTLAYGQPFTVQTPDAARIAKVSLIRYGSVTHSINMAQRFLPLAFTAGTSSLTVTPPANANLAPPGYYMLFLSDTNGVPSVAATVHF